jgi:REP element-mobilizing transposase RayT
MLPQSLDARLTAILGRRARDLGCAVLAAGCAADHVHVVVRLASAVSLAKLVQRLKGASAYELNPEGGTRRFAWQDGYWAESLGPHDLDPIARYVRGQREHHDASHPSERWLLATDEPSSWAEARSRARPNGTAGCSNAALGSRGPSGGCR